MSHFAGGASRMPVILGGFGIPMKAHIPGEGYPVHVGHVDRRVFGYFQKTRIAVSRESLKIGIRHVVFVDGIHPFFAAIRAPGHGPVAVMLKSEIIPILLAFLFQRSHGAISAVGCGQVG